MRVIAGTARGRKLRSLPLEGLRPMLDRVKEALFNIISGRIPGAEVLDLFCGSGALGIEALSRGAERCIFVEKDKRLVNLTLRNVELCGFSEMAEVLRCNVFSLEARPPPLGSEPADLVFVDPPYAMVAQSAERTRLMETLTALQGTWVGSQALLVLHHEPMRHPLEPGPGLRAVDRRTYGRSELTFLEFSGEQAT